MNTASKFRISWLLLAAAFISVVFAALAMPLPAQAQTLEIIGPISPVVADPVAGFIADLAVKYPWVTAALSIIGILRLVFKPIMTLLAQRAAATESTEDDDRLVAVQKSWAFRALAWVLDYTASVKIK